MPLVSSWGARLTEGRGRRVGLTEARRSPRVQGSCRLLTLASSLLRAGPPVSFQAVCQPNLLGLTQPGSLPISGESVTSVLKPSVSVCDKDLPYKLSLLISLESSRQPASHPDTSFHSSAPSIPPGPDFTSNAWNSSTETLASLFRPLLPSSS